MYSTIKWMHIISKHSENAVRVTLNRELKSNNIVIETNDYKEKYKILSTTSIIKSFLLKFMEIVFSSSAIGEIIPNLIKFLIL